MFEVLLYKFGQLLIRISAGPLGLRITGRSQPSSVSRYFGVLLTRREKGEGGHCSAHGILNFVKFILLWLFT